MFLQGVQLRAVTGEESSALKTKALLKVNQTFNIILSGILCEDFLPEMRIGKSEVGVRTDSYMCLVEVVIQCRLADSVQEGSVWVDALIVWAPTNEVNKTSLLYATKIVEFQGLAVEVRSGFIPVSFKFKPRHEGSHCYPCIGSYFYLLFFKLACLVKSLRSWKSFGRVSSVNDCLRAYP